MIKDHTGVNPLNTNLFSNQKGLKSLTFLFILLAMEGSRDDVFLGQKWETS